MNSRAAMIAASLAWASLAFAGCADADLSDDAADGTGGDALSGTTGTGGQAEGPADLPAGGETAEPGGAMVDPVGGSAAGGAMVGPEDGPEDGPDDEPDEVLSGHLDADARADVEVKRAIIEGGLMLGKTAFSDELNLGFQQAAQQFRYQSSVARGVDYVPPTSSVTCPFLVTPDEAAERTTDCRSLTDRAKVSSYGQLTNLMARNPIDTAGSRDPEGDSFWFEQSLMTGIVNETELAIRHLREVGLCDRGLEPAQNAFEEGVEVGRRLYAERLNQRLAETGNPMNYPDDVRTMEVCSIDTSFLAPARSRAEADVDTRMTAEPLCGDEFSAGSPDMLARLQTAEAKYRDGIRRGIETEDGMASERLFRVVPCNVGDPLVLDLDGDGVQLKGPRQGARFDLFGWGQDVQMGWISGGDVFVAMDRNGNGRIDSGRELFTNFVGDRGFDEVESGFTSLARHDADANGRIDAADPAFAELRVWQDTDGDGRSAPEELRTLAAAGIAAIDVRATKSGVLPMPHGAHFVRDVNGWLATGSWIGAATDAWFTYGRVRP